MRSFTRTGIVVECTLRKSHAHLSSMMLCNRLGWERLLLPGSSGYCYKFLKAVLFLVPLFTLFCGRDLPSPTYTGVKSGGTMAPQISRVPVKCRDMYEATVEFHAYTF